MNLQLPQQLQNFINNLSNKGIKIPMLVDCLTGKQSLTYSLTLIYGILVLLGCIESTEHLVNYDRAFTVLQWVGGGYLIRKGMAHAMPVNNKSDNNQDKGEGQ